MQQDLPIIAKIIIIFSKFLCADFKAVFESIFKFQTGNVQKDILLSYHNPTLKIHIITRKRPKSRHS